MKENKFFDKIIKVSKTKVKLFGVIEFKKATKKEKEEMKKIQKFNKITKITFFSILFYIIFFLINNIIMSYNENYAYFYVSNITNFKNGVLYYLLGHIKYFNLIFPVVFFITYTYLVIKSNSPKYTIKKRNNYYNIAISFCLLFLVFFGFSSIIDTHYYVHIANFDNLLFKETKDKTYTVDELTDLNVYLKDKVLEYAHSMNRDKNGDIITDINYNKQAINDLRNVSETLPLLKGLYPTKSAHLSDKLKSIYGSDTVGLTSSYSTYFDYELAPISTLNTVMHEYCHTKGINRENETVFCSFLAGINSDNNISKYSAYLEAFSRSNYALDYFDSNSSINIENEISHLCLTKNYTELCDLYIKNNNTFIHGADKIFITTYELKHYFDYFDKFVEILNILKNENASFLVNGEETVLEDILTLVENGSNYSLRISLDLNNNVYNRIHDYIKDDKFFLAIYQKDLDEKEPPEIENPTKHFLEPFDKNDEGIFIDLSYSSETYSYERATRLFLEYFEKYGYK